jgi:hypothetical protein
VFSAKTHLEHCSTRDRGRILGDEYTGASRGGGSWAVGGG